MLYGAFGQMLPSETMLLLVVTLLPVAAETLFKKFIWRTLIDKKHGLKHPRLYALADALLSITSIYTGSVKTVFRLGGAVICLFFQLFRADNTVMVDRAFLPLDPHFTSCTGLLTAARINLEFGKIRRHSSANAHAEPGPPIELLPVVVDTDEAGGGGGGGGATPGSDGASSPVATTAPPTEWAPPPDSIYEQAQ